MDEKLESILRTYRESQGNITVLTGAGISAESGIPTFRGKEGYWTVGSQVYHPEEMATLEMFRLMPYEVWQWYLYRKTVCANAQPNAGHQAIANLENLFRDRFCLITQNVDGLHLRAGNSFERTFQIHGNINTMRCSEECTTEVTPIPPDIPPKDKETSLTEEDKRKLVCPRCGAVSRPHVLWFDEYYNEHHFRFNSSIQRARETDLLLVAGTSGATNLPMQVGVIVAQKGSGFVYINPEPNPFSYMARDSTSGYYYCGSSGEILPAIVEFLAR